jgi:hypothetical protein
MGTENAAAWDSREPTREEVNCMEGPVLLEFGASW